MGPVAVEFSITKAHQAQSCMARKIITQDRLPKEVKLIAGIDAAYTEDFAIGTAAVVDYKSLEVLETQIITQQARFPYIPTLLSFRELPVVIAAIRKLKHQPDVLLVDGHGRAHPYRCGLASHLGLALGMPTVGVAKSMLIGEVIQVGEDIFLVDNGEVIGAVIPSFVGARPVYVSVGHLVSLETAVKIVKHCIRKNRMPEPINIAHKLATQKRKAKIALSTNSDPGELRIEP